MVAASRARMTPKRKRLWLLLASLCVLGAVYFVFRGKLAGA